MTKAERITEKTRLLRNGIQKSRMYTVYTYRKNMYKKGQNLYILNDQKEV